ncbi:hypothetical protein ABGB16_07505 [Micromonospora sp. B11E3]|uniref:hypothetical protein n=1 Tax=Micromonospora sp. B11E3 TaxID=3153562 RepID=UPI00325D3464
MRAAVQATTGRWARLALLLCTLVGLTAMHTLGHGGHAAGGAHEGHHPAGSPEPRPVLVAHAAVPAPAARSELSAWSGAIHGDCREGGCAQARPLPGDGSGGSLPGWSVCLAVLGAFGLAVLVAVLLLAGARAVGVAGGASDGGSPGPRAPPPRPVGLRLAEISVSRT